MMPSFAGDVYFSLIEMLGDGDEVVEHVLLLLEHAGVVPRLAVLAAAAHVGGHPDRRRARATPARQADRSAAR